MLTIHNTYLIDCYVDYNNSAIWVHDSIIVTEVCFLTDHDGDMIFVLVIMIIVVA